MRGSSQRSVNASPRQHSPDILASLSSSYLWHGSSVQSHNDSAHIFIAMLDIEVDLVGDLGALRSLGGLGEEDEDECEDQQAADGQFLERLHLEAIFRSVGVV